jgi:superfamily II DNA/RNA helicase
LQAALAEKGISEPTEIQAAAVPALLRDRSSDFMLASHTGSGKTLAYLLPVGACALAPVLAVLCLGW